MPTVQPLAPDLANRRMAAGMLLSLLLHAVALSIRFGLPGMQAGGAGPITVSLAPVPAPAPPDTPGSGFRLVDPLPMAPPPPQAVTKPVRRRRSQSRPKPPRGKTPSTPVIVQQDNHDAAFRMPLAEAQAGPGPGPELAAVPERPVAPEPVVAG